MLLRGSAHEIVLSQAEVLCAATRIRAGVYDGLFDAGIDVITAGINEQSGGATNRAVPFGRLRLLTDNARTYNQIVPNLTRVAPTATILVVTDPPDPLADVAGELTIKLGTKSTLIGDALA